jgi:hypothetical protein
MCSADLEANLTQQMAERRSHRRRCLLGGVKETTMTDSRDIQHGVNDPVSGVDVKRRFRENQTPHERAQSAADVRREALPDPNETFLPEALRRPPTAPLNSRTGRRPTS